MCPEGMVHELLVVIYGHKEHPINRDLLSDSDFSSENDTKICRLKAGSVLRAAVCNLTPLPNTLQPARQQTS